VIFGSLLSLGACGDGDETTGTGDRSSAPTTTSEKKQIQQLFARYNSAMESRRFKEVCSLHTAEFNEELLSEVRDAFGDRRPATCERAIRMLVMSDYQPPPLTSIDVSGTTATGRVGPRTSVWQFARVGSAWKVAYAN
jgi:hypothetical protein